MAAPIVYKWTDANAPVARGQRRSLCDILYACLVTGYGDKPGAGWTRAYVNATFDRAAFRNNPTSGTGFYLRVNGAGAPNAYSSLLTGYEVMTSDNAGLRAFASDATLVELSNTADTSARPWVLVADDRAFYFICWPGVTGSPGNSDITACNFFFGDCVRFKTDDAYFCCLAASVSNVSYGSFGMLIPPSTGATDFPHAWASPRSQTGVIGYRKQGLNSGGGPIEHAAGMGFYGASYTPGDVILLSRPTINNAAAYSFRGWPPGLYCPCHANAFDQLATITQDGKSFLSIRQYVGGTQGTANYFISLDDWRA